MNHWLIYFLLQYLCSPCNDIVFYQMLAQSPDRAHLPTAGLESVSWDARLTPSVRVTRSAAATVVGAPARILSEYDFKS